MGSMIHSWLITPDQAIIDAVAGGFIITTGSLLIPRMEGTCCQAWGSTTRVSRRCWISEDRIETEETLATAEYLAAIMKKGLIAPSEQQTALRGGLLVFYIKSSLIPIVAKSYKGE
jgi:hypothetical protein